MRKLLYFLASILLITACNKNISDKPVATAVAGTDDQQQDQLSTQQIDDVIKASVQDKGSFNWKDVSDRTVWSALKHSDGILSVGYKPAGESMDISGRIHLININDNNWKTARQQVLAIIYNQEKKGNASLQMKDIEVWKETKLPYINVKVDDINTIKLLRQSNLVRYAEPMGYDPIEKFDREAAELSGGIIGGSGCGGYVGDNTLVAGSDYSVIAPNAKASWNYSFHGIQNAWTKSTGAGVKVEVIDTGVDPSQDNLGSQFNQGQSAGRTIEKIYTLPGAGNADDGCGHGTAMSGTVAAPRCTDGNSCGVAYNCNFIICRASEDVYLDQSSEVKGVSDAYIQAGDNSTVKITSMSTGRITGSGQIKDAIDYAYNKGKLIFCAGGTSFSWTALFVGVIFPASLPNVQAITGIKDGTGLKACADCHKGKQIDFVIVMEKTNGGLHALTTATSGDVPTTVGGSSVATATAAGIAALVWSRFPTYTRENLLNKLTTTASGYPNKNANYGWGKLNADAATN
ncbi:MAG TPA: S8/S53 family peptidase [Panacibacter sp.]|nr:S8/S53 family peptidase [Panacibacter sp.]HNP45323.1 S8/S53 family peptidase [Panacibacter sp.]